MTSIREPSASNTRKHYGKVRGWTVQTMNNACGISFWNTVLSTIDSIGVSNFGGRTAGSVDNVLLTQVPEPPAVLLGGLGVLALLRRRRM